MVISIAYLGPVGTNSETAALAYKNWLTTTKAQEVVLRPSPSITKTLYSVFQGETDLAVVPVENSIEGSVAVTLDLFWELEGLKIQQALILPISHALVSKNTSLEAITAVYSHPQALGQCQRWLEKNLPQAQLIPTNSTTEALQYPEKELTFAAISAPRAAELYNLPILQNHINDYPENYTRFWTVGLNETHSGGFISLAFSVPKNIPGALVKPLQVFAERNINMSRIESRPTKRSLGEYLFFIDLEASLEEDSTQAALSELSNYTEVLKVFGNYNILPVI